MRSSRLRGSKKKDRSAFRSFPEHRSASLKPSVGEDALELFHDLLFRMRLGDRELLDEQAACRIEHLALSEREFLVALQHQQITQHLGDLKRRTGFDLLGV